jgi:hypothetical protein
MATDEEPLMQSDSNGVHSHKVMARGHVLHSMRHYNDGTTSMMIWSHQHQYTRPHTVCIKFTNAFPMVKRAEHKQTGCTGAACLCAG